MDLEITERGGIGLSKRMEIGKMMFGNFLNPINRLNTTHSHS